MAAKTLPATLYPSPFAFGFYAGLGFFCASVLISCLGFVVMVVLTLVLGITATGVVAKWTHPNASMSASQTQSTDGSTRPGPTQP